MVKTSDFKTRNEIVKLDLPKINGNNQFKSKTIVALDGGYSAVKGVCPFSVFSFPSYAVKTESSFSVVGKLRDDDLQFRDNKTGEVWLVGRTSEALMDGKALESTEDSELYTRYRYGSDVYKVIMATGMALGLLGSPEDSENKVLTEVYLQTGLPSEYLERDTARLKKALVGDYDISIKVGNRDWATFKFSLDGEHIDVMEQPKGTLNAIVYDNGKVSKEGVPILQNSVVILDIGFGTEDIFSFRNAISTGHKTYSDTAMRAVFENTARRVEEAYPEAKVKVFEFQKYLEDGQIPYFDVDTYGMNYVEFADILEDVNRKLCDKSIERLMREYGNLQDYRYLVVTGGTGESRIEYIREKLRGLPKLSIILGNKNYPELSCIYGNVIGYYMFRHAKLASEMRKAGADVSAS